METKFSSVGSNYRAACRARTSAEFIAKLGIVEEEADETLFWLELIAELELLKPELLKPLTFIKISFQIDIITIQRRFRYENALPVP